MDRTGIGVVLLLETERTHRGGGWEQHGGGAQRREDGRRWRSVTAAEGVLLGRPGPVAGGGRLRIAGNGWCTGSTATPESSMERARRERRMSGR
jgi:hypothetical protein